MSLSVSGVEIDTQKRSLARSKRRIEATWGRIAEATMAGTLIAAGDKTTQLGTAASSCLRTVRSNIPTKSRIPGRRCSTINPYRNAQISSCNMMATPVTSGVSANAISWSLGAPKCRVRTPRWLRAEQTRRPTSVSPITRMQGSLTPSG